MAKEYIIPTLARVEEDGAAWGEYLKPPIKPIDPGDGWATTLACGEEGNDCGGLDPDPIEVTTMAIGEEGDPVVLDPEPIEFSTMALGEEGDPWYEDYM